MGVVSCVSCTYTAQRVPWVHNFEKKLLILPANLNLDGFLPPDELYKFEILENVIILSRKYNLEWILTGANSE